MVIVVVLVVQGLFADEILTIVCSCRSLVLVIHGVSVSSGL